MSLDVTDATFPTEVVERSKQVTVVVDLWAEWCGPCKTLGPILEKVVDETAGAVVLVKVDVDANTQIPEAFKVQSIPAVYAMRDGKVIDGFVGALSEDKVREFITRLLPTEQEDALAALLAAGDEASLRLILEQEPGHAEAVLALAALLVVQQDETAKAEGLALLERIPASTETRHLAALARVGPADEMEDVRIELDRLLASVKDDETARQRFVDLLEVLGPDDPRTAAYRKELTARLF
ncbi:MAG: tetratricopeptide repeat protein [Acidimicrobiia bacterium]|nr:tetratricopeptide repeat protein [Acidimicrobiia bacterium]